MEIRFTARSIGLWVSAGIAAFLAAHLLVQALRFGLGDESLYGALTLFSLGSDRNFPTYFASTLILSCAALLALTGRVESREGRPSLPWFGLATVFLFLSADEILEIHERLIEPLRSVLDAGGVFYYTWVIPYGIATLLFVLVFARFLLRLPARTRNLFVLAGCVFVAGALGMEMLGGLRADRVGSANVLYVVCQTIEELLEMSGMALFLFALTDYLQHSVGGVVIRLADQAQRQPVAVSGNAAHSHRAASRSSSIRPVAAPVPGAARRESRFPQVGR